MPILALSKSNDRQKWDELIDSNMLTVKALGQKIARLQKLILVCEKYRDAEEPFPGGKTVSEGEDC